MGDTSSSSSSTLHTVIAGGDVGGVMNGGLLTFGGVLDIVVAIRTMSAPRTTAEASLEMSVGCHYLVAGGWVGVEEEVIGDCLVVEGFNVNELHSFGRCFVQDCIQWTPVYICKSNLQKMIKKSNTFFHILF